MGRNDNYNIGINIDATSRKIGQLIDASGFSDKELADIMGLSVQAINKWRHGHNLPDIENLFLLSRIIGNKMDDFIIPVTVDCQPEISHSFDSISASAISRLWVYFYKLNRQNVKFN